MEAKRFDSVARIVGATRSRRGLLASLAALAPAVGRTEFAWGKKKKKGCPPCKKRKKGKCKSSLPDGAACAGGTCRGGVCASCTTSADGAISVSSGSTVGKQSLQARHTIQPFGAAGQTNSQLEFTLDSAPLLTITTTSAGALVTVTHTYGAAFSGIRRAQFVNDGTTITGDIDGRAIAPMPASADPSSATFQDGAPPPNVQVDPGLSSAIAAAWQKLGPAAATCNGGRSGAKSASRRRQARRGTKGDSRRTRSDDEVGVEAFPQNSDACFALYLPCGTAYAGCIYALSSCATALWFAPICAAIGFGACSYTAAVCRRYVRLGPTCCPVRCGGNLDPLNPLGDDPGCCEQGETCLNPNEITSVCCLPGRTNCGGECCLAGSCLRGSCCESPNFICGTACVGPFTNCCGGNPCNGTCINNTCCAGGFDCGGFCCQDGKTCCGNSCCPTAGQVCCNGACCPSGYDCQNNQCIQVCNPGEVPCAGQCCTGGKTCRRCPNGARICASAPCVN